MAHQRRDDWDRLYAEYQSSGLSKAAFSRKKGISENTVYTRFLKIERRIRETQKQVSAEVNSALFAEVQLEENPHPAKPSTLRLDFKQFSITVDENTDSTLLANTIRTVLSVC